MHRCVGSLTSCGDAERGEHSQHSVDIVRGLVYDSMTLSNSTDSDKGCKARTEEKGKPTNSYDRRALSSLPLQMEYTLVAHRCVGTTASIVQKGKVRVRFETSYKGGLHCSLCSHRYTFTVLLLGIGEYFEPFYLELEFTGRRLKVNVWL